MATLRLTLATACARWASRMPRTCRDPAGRPLRAGVGRCAVSTSRSTNHHRNDSRSPPWVTVAGSRFPAWNWAKSRSWAIRV
jgi:hypothetical protein